jgi:MFS family permease
MTGRRRPPWWGGRVHLAVTIVVFVTLASLDNAAIAAIPQMVLPVSEALHASETAIGVMTATVILLAALTAVAWGFWGDRSDRKRLLFGGTLVWALGTFLSGGAGSYRELFIWQIVTAVGLGAIASVGFSVISDFVSPRHRGLAMSFWGLAEGLGTVAGGLVASQLGAEDFGAPLRLIALLGAGFAVLYLFTFSAPRGFREPALQALHQAGAPYDHRIDASQIPALFRRRTNVWLIAQGLSAQFAYGSLIWVPLLYQEKVAALGYDVETATRVGGLMAAILRLGGLFSIVAGAIGDRMQRRSLSGRAVVSAVGILGAVPFFLVFFFVPLRGLEVTNGASTSTLLPEVLHALVTNGWVAVAFFTSLLALALTSADSPNWFALVSDVNLPEHRGTVFGLGNLSNGVGRAAGNALTAAAAGGFERTLPPPLNWAVGLAVFQVFFLPTGYCYGRAARTSPGDIRQVEAILRQRAKHHRSGDPAG